MVVTRAAAVEPQALAAPAPATQGRRAETTIDYGSVAPTSAANSSRVDTPVLAHARWTWLSTVRTERLMTSAISRFDNPSATSEATSRSRPVIGSSARAAAIAG